MSAVTGLTNKLAGRHLITVVLAALSRSKRTQSPDGRPPPPYNLLDRELVVEDASLSAAFPITPRKDRLSAARFLSSSVLGSSNDQVKVAFFAPPVGIEPTTCGLGMRSRWSQRVTLNRI